jgi:hypothetical protein
MIRRPVPLQQYSDTHNGKPLLDAAFALLKHYMSGYLTAVYIEEENHKEFKRESLAGEKRNEADKYWMGLSIEWKSFHQPPDKRKQKVVMK